MSAGSESKALLRGYLAATGIYVAGYVGLWVTVYRDGRMEGAREVVAYAIAAGMCVAFVVVTGRLALAVAERRVLTAAAVSVAAVLTAGLVRTAMAALGMRQFLVWDHDDVIVQAALEEAFFAIVCLAPAAIVAVCTRLLFRRGQPRGA